MLNKEQQQAIEKLHNFLNSSEMEIKLISKSGTGKTHTLSEFINQLSNKKIAIATLSHKAKTVIKGKVKPNYNVKFFTIASLLNMKLNQETGEFTEENLKNNEINTFDIICIDECSMINEATVKLIRKKKNKKCKIIYVGDFRQLPPIGEKMSSLEKDTSIETIELHKVERQSSTSSILAYSDLYGDAVINNKPCPIIIREDSINVKYVSTFLKVLDIYKETFKTCLIDSNAIKVVCYRNATKVKINAQIREVIFNGYPEIPYVKGDCIILDDNYGDLDNSQEMVITDCNLITEGNYLLYRIEAFKIDSLDEKLYTLYVLNTHSIEQHKKDVAYLFDLYKKNKLRDTLSDAWRLKQKYAAINYNFCLSSHKSQGSSYKNTVVLEYDIMNSYMSDREKNQCMYVATTRSIEQTIIV